jgi:hypothetical protein
LFEAEGEGRRHRTKVRFSGREDAALGIGGIKRVVEGAASGADKTDAAAAAVEGIGSAGFVEVTDGDESGTGALGDDSEASQGAAQGLIGGGIEAWGEKGGEGIDDDEGGFDLDDDLGQDGSVVGDDEEGVVGVLAGDGGEGDDARRVAAGGIEARAYGVGDIVLSRDEEDGAGGVGLATRERLAAGDASGEFAEEGGLADAGVAVEEGDFAGGEAAGGEPLHRRGGYRLQADEVGERIALASGPTGVLRHGPSAR